MLIPELKKMLEDYKEEDLRKIIVDLYKVIPKALKEEKDIDLMIENIHTYKNIKSSEKVDVHSLVKNVDYFVSNAYEGNYLSPNRIISKNERGTWKSKVRSFLKDLQSVPTEGEEGDLATEALTDLFSMLQYASGRYLFNTKNNPFHLVGTSECALLAIVLQRKFSKGITRELIESAISLSFGNEYGIYCTYTLINCFKTLGARDFALEVVLDKYKKWSSSTHFKGKKTLTFLESQWNNAMVSVIGSLYLLLDNYDEAIDFYKKYFESRRASGIHGDILLLLENNNMVDEWLNYYENSYLEKDKKSDSLIERYEFVKENKKFPEVFIIY